MLITDTILCANCEDKIEWYYQIPQRITSKILEVDRIPNDKIKISSCVHIEDNLYELSCYCHKCRNNNIFQYFSDYKLHIN